MDDEVEVPGMYQMCYWGENDEIAAYDHETVAVVARTKTGYIVLLGVEEIEAHVTFGEVDLL